MRLGLTCTAEHSVNRLVNAEHINDLINIIHQNTDYRYLCEIRDGVCYLKPRFSDLPYRNSFVPEIEVQFSQNKDSTILHLTGRPDKFVRIFMMFWFGVLAMIQLLLLTIAFTSGFSFSLFIPAVMCVFGYLLFKFGCNIPFCSIVRAIRNEFL